MTFELYPLRFCFVTEDSIHFPDGKSGNILRGAFGNLFKKIACVPECRDAHTCDLRGACAYARIFEPARAGAGPSGLADWPRPFVFRASHLDGATIARQQPFHFDLNVFDLRDPAIACFVLAFSQLAHEGIGPRRGRAHLASVWQLDSGGEPRTQIYDGTRFLMSSGMRPLSLPLSPPDETIHAIRVEFVTPTELKGASGADFQTLFARIRDRISTLRALYGAGPLDIDFKAMGERAALVRTTLSDLHQVDVSRLSTRTGQTHSLGGFAGTADYEGALAEFMSFLQTAQWTGVGRQTVWGKGQIRVTRRR